MCGANVLVGPTPHTGPSRRQSLANGWRHSGPRVPTQGRNAPGIKRRRSKDARSKPPGSGPIRELSGGSDRGHYEHQCLPSQVQGEDRFDRPKTTAGLSGSSNHSGTPWVQSPRCLPKRNSRASPIEAPAARRSVPTTSGGTVVLRTPLVRPLPASFSMHPPSEQGHSDSHLLSKDRQGTTPTPGAPPV